MSDENRNSNDDRQKRNGDFRMSPRNWVVCILVTCCLVLIACSFYKNVASPSSDTISQNRFKELVDADLIEKATVKFNPESETKDITGSYYLTDKDGKKDPAKHPVPFRANVHLTPEQISDLLNRPNFDKAEPSTLLINLIWGLLPFLIIGLLIIGILICFIIIRRKSENQPGVPGQHKQVNV